MDYFEPKTVSEALSILTRYGESAKVIAGGTDILVDMKFKDTPACLVNIKPIPDLSFVRQNGGSLLIGPLTTIREMKQITSFGKDFPCFGRHRINLHLSRYVMLQRSGETSVGLLPREKCFHLSSSSRQR
jgi:CO/xanthine dehydrogenase FAD-binding subunit